MAIKEILAWLIERHADDMGIGRQHAHAATDLSERQVKVDGKNASLSEKTIRNLLNGRVGKPRRHTCKILVELFRPHIPALHQRWFYMTLDEFKARAEGKEEGAELDPARDQGRNQNGDDALEGTYVCYRHAFSANLTNIIAREVLHVFRSGDGLGFRMSYVHGTKGRTDELLEFRGGVMTAVPSMVLFGSSEGPDKGQRVRALSARNNGHIERPELENYKLGILLSTREEDGVPCAACTLMVRVQRAVESEEDLTAFMKAVTGTDVFEKTVGQDFVEQDWTILRLFLDNRPSRSPKNPSDPIDAAMMALEDTGSRAPVLRINQYRFERSMEEVFQRALDADHIVPTFRADWSPLPPEG